MTSIFHALIYNPIYNALIFMMGTFSWIDLGLAVVLLTIIVKGALFPLAKGAVTTQEAMKIAKPELSAITDKFKTIKNPTTEQRQAMGKETLAVYNKYGIKPFASFATLLIQIPIFLALYWIFYSGGLPVIKTDILYPFVTAPETIRMTLFGIIDISGKSILLAGLAGVTQFIYLSSSMGKLDMSKNGTKFGALGSDFGKTLQLQMKYGLPFLIAFIAYISSIVALYFIATNIYMYTQDLLIKKKHKRPLIEAE